MVSVTDELQEAIPEITIDAQIGRVFSAGPPIVSSMLANGSLGSTVILELGTNGPFSVEEGQEILDQIGKERTVYWVLPYGRHLEWQELVDGVIRNLSVSNPNVTLIDWPAQAAAHPGWINDDGVHLSPDGQKGYTRMVLDSIGYQPK